MNKLFWSSVIIACGIVFFTKGFLLIKLEIGQKSTACHGRGSHYDYSSGSCKQSRSPHSQYHKLVILIIDALRYDFAYYHENAAKELPFHNNMPIFHSLMEKEGCRKARLWRFKADAPTTTMQRLKGLMTGSLPTFIDVSENFASTEITEDSLLDQFIQSQMNITFMGDDTWMGLFPGRFNRAFPYPSFDVKDLHLVDDGVNTHLLPELAREDWHVLIAHFLGVDHCGHRYGPYHPEMPRKLRQMNEVVKNVVNAIDRDTLLLVMGDHGMTPTGDHGGETLNETSATLFAYSPIGAFKEACDKSEYEVNQVDIVPTISLLLGTSIPFANLGIAIKDMFPEEEDTSVGEFVKALSMNMKQMHNYLKAYQEMTKSLPRDQFENFNIEIERLDELKVSYKTSIEYIEKSFISAMKSARDMCRMVWAKFDIGFMVSGITILLGWLVKLTSMQLEKFSYDLKTFSYAAICLTLLCMLLPSVFLLSDELLIHLQSWGTFVLFIGLIVLHLMKSQCFLPELSTAISVIFVTAYSISFTSNSFVICEDSTVLYLFLSAMMFVFYLRCHVKITQFHDSKRFIFNLLFVLLCARISFFFRCCRAEQFWCFDDNVAVSANNDAGFLPRVLLSSITVLSCAWLPSALLKGESSLEPQFFNSTVILSALLCTLHWLLQLLPNELLETLPAWSNIVFPRCFYALFTGQMIFLWINPTLGCINLKLLGNLKTNKKMLITEESVGNEALTESFSKLILCLALLFCLLLGPLQATAISLWLGSSYCIFQILSVKSRKFVGLDSIVTWNLMCSFWWFSTGHQASLSSIRWDAAFVGFQGNHITNVIPAVLLTLDTFSMQILSTVCVPILLLWNDGRLGILNSKESMFNEALQDVFLKHYSYHVIKMLGCMVAALIHRRHLMVWWIFAPRFLFEMISLIFIIFSSLGTYLFIQRWRKQALLITQTKTTH